MADIDTSNNIWNPSPTHDDLIAIRDRMMADLEAGKPSRIIRVAALPTADLAFALRKRERYHAAHPTGRRTDVRRAFAALETARHLGLDVAGRVLGVREAGS